MKSHADRLAALRGREFLPAARDLRQLMERIAARRVIRPRTRVRIERAGSGICIILALAAALFLGA